MYTMLCIKVFEQDEDVEISEIRERDEGIREEELVKVGTKLLGLLRYAASILCYTIDQDF